VLLFDFVLTCQFPNLLQYRLSHLKLNVGDFGVGHLTGWVTFLSACT